MTVRRDEAQPLEVFAHQQPTPATHNPGWVGTGHETVVSVVCAVT